ncbi:hypothetical protein [Xanthomonas translucens]|uniref:hypothetical protein n=1 Tax=Xanthomonas campestris pv. translucens TaxID=343 RepID=UPI00071E9AB3|nr:hypothetical protein [Xanthomonas translucens]KTF39624.1 hypothetical protein OZ12_11160 [Xanthomonas translucens pv. translucens]KWV10403.1 hypothetical protein ATB54_19370 [Xanthomonas translucens]MCS3361272.1 hypothetical protein [Xanthomonas translucens pv. translucens]MCS3375029.1 hypothetical protein [Xanthomonas translucens pv. translucens]MCT8275940.1 hypothetical protein [Xanthomonas translucens pv. translucens]
MSKLTIITDRALDLASHAGDSLRHIGPQANKWLHSGAAMGALKTGAALGAVKSGTRVARTAVRRNPVIAIAAAAVGVGLLGYAIYRKRQRDRSAPIEGDSQRIEASKRGNAGARRSAARTSRRAAATQDATEE